MNNQRLTDKLLQPFRENLKDKILNKDFEKDFVLITKNVAFAFNNSCTFISIEGEEVIHIKAQVNCEFEKVVKNENLLTPHVLKQEEPLIIEDAHLDTQYPKEMETMKKGGFRFYAAQRLVSEEGIIFGTLCVIGKEPMKVSDCQLNILKNSAQQTVSLIHRLRNDRDNFEKLSELNGLKLLLERESYFIEVDKKGNLISVNEAFTKVFGEKAHDNLIDSIRKSSKREEIKRSLESENVHHTQISMFDRNKEKTYLNITMIPTARTHLDENTFIIIGHDISREVKTTNLFSETQELAKIGGWDYDLETHFISLTSGAKKILGVKEPEPKPRSSLLRYFKLNERKKLIHGMAKAFKQGTTYEGTFSIQLGKNQKKFVLIKATPEEERSRKNPIIHGLIQDVTELRLKDLKRELLEKQLKQSFEYLNLAIEGSGLGIWRWNIEENTVDYDKSWAKMLGFKHSEIGNTPDEWLSRLHPDDRSKCRQDYLDYLSGKIPHYENMHRVLNAEGKYINLLSKAKVTEWSKSGNPKIFTGTHMDISETISKQKQLDLIISSRGIGTWIMNLQDNTVHWDDGMFRLYEVNPRNFKGNGEDWSDALDPECREEMSAKFAEAIESKDVLDSIFIINTPSGRKSIGSTARIERDLDRRAVTVMGINWDRTSEQEMVDEAHKQLKVAQQSAKLASIGVLAAGVGHEINNPLAIIKGYILAILDMVRENLSEPSIKYLEKADMACDRISKIVKGLRTFSRVDNTEAAAFNIGASLKESISLVKDIYSADGIEVKSDSLEDDFELKAYGNKGKFQQIIMNLIANARDATEGQAKRIIDIHLENKAYKVIVTVTDNGTGIPLEVQDKIFDPFYTTKDVDKGTGIGLSLSKNLIEEMDGRLYFESEKDKGTTFYVELPLTKKGDTEDKNKINIVSLMDLKDKKFLIVDDEEDLRIILERTLSKHGATLVFATNGLEALEIINTKEDGYFDIILSDIKMPKMDGVTFINEVFKKLQEKSPKFIFMTGGTNINLEQQEIAPGSLSKTYLYKPFNEVDVLESIKKVLLVEPQRQSA